jgi:hypothetical protein
LALPVHVNRTVLRRTITIRRLKVSRAVDCNSTPRRCKGHPAEFHLVSKIVFHPVFDLEISVFKKPGRRSAFPEE